MSERLKKGDLSGRAWTKRASKVYLLVTEAGLPYAVDVAPAHQGEVKACLKVARQVPRQVALTADRAYDVPSFRHWLKRRGIYPLIRYKKVWMSNWNRYKPAKTLESVFCYKERFKVERAFSWFEKFKRLNIRYERLGHLYKSFWQLAASCLLFHHFAR